MIFFYTIIKNLSNFFCPNFFYPEILLLITIVGLVLWKDLNKIELNVYIGLYLYFIMFNGYIVDNYVGILFQKTQEIQLFGFAITLFALISSLSLSECREVKILYLLLLLFLNLLICSTNFLSFFICLEASSFSIFLICSFGPKTVVKSCSVIKYFVISSLSSTVLLLAVALLYFFTGSVNFSNIVIYYSVNVSTFNLWLPMLLFLCGLTLKLGLFPGYSWVADVSEGISFSGFLLVNLLSKLTLLIFIKVVLVTIFNFSSFFIFIGICSYLAGLLVTLSQKKIVRFLAYGSITHLGFAFSTFTLLDAGFFSVGYLFVYFFALNRIISLLDHTVINLEKIVYLTDLGSLLDLDVRVHFAHGVFELAGIPPYNIFWTKIILIFFLIKNGFFIVASFFLLISVIGLFYYLRLIKNMFYDITSPYGIVVKSLDTASFFVMEILFAMFLLYGVDIGKVGYSLGDIFKAHTVTLCYYTHKVKNFFATFHPSQTPFPIEMFTHPVFVFFFTITMIYWFSQPGLKEEFMDSSELYESKQNDKN